MTWSIALNTQMGVLDDAAQMFRETLEGRHGAVVRDCLSILGNRFAKDDAVGGVSEGRSGSCGAGSSWARETRLSSAKLGC